MYQKIYEVFHNKYNSAGIVFKIKIQPNENEAFIILIYFVEFLNLSK